MIDVLTATRVRSARQPLLLAGLALAGTVYVALVDPNSPGRYGICPFLALTGMYCAACGGLRAVHELTRLDLAGAWAMNPLLLVVLPLVVWAWARWLARTWGLATRAPTQRADRRSSRLAWVFLVAVGTFTVARNVPAFVPWLAP